MLRSLTETVLNWLGKPLNQITASGTRSTQNEAWDLMEVTGIWRGARCKVLGNRSLQRIGRLINWC